MTDESHFTVSEPAWDRDLWWMVLASGGLHLLAVALIVFIPHSFAHRPPPLMSYTVDLVAPDKVGGNNMIAGGKGRVEGAPMAAAPKAEPPPTKVEPPKPPEPKVQAPPPEPPPAPKEVAKGEPPKPEPPKPAPPKAEPPPKADEMALAEKAKPAPPVPTVAKVVPTAPAAKAPPSAPAHPAPSPKVVAKAEAPQSPPNAPAKSSAEAAKEAAARARDERIAAAVRRVEQQAGTRGGGMGKEAAVQPGAPISAGPGEGAGGMVRGVEYLLYYNQMISRIKQTWAWAGANRALEATVHFSISENGEVRDVRIARPSGDPSYDASVQRAVSAANPLPAPPEGYRKEFSDVELVFRPDDLKM